MNNLNGWQRLWVIIAILYGIFIVVLAYEISENTKIDLLKVFFVWVLPLIVLYVFGWLIGWVRKGFK